nr:uncharacterized mitochondrial protein AtMg00810-like [Tanacetum cinerariifolium]
MQAGIFSSSSYNDDFCADVTNLALSVAVDPVATKRVNTIHPQSQILGELQSPVQTRSKVQKSKFGEIPLPDGKIAIGTKWILKNKRDVRAIVVRNKARLVAQGHRVVKALYGLHQAPRGWYARLSTFLLKHHYKRGTIDKTLFLKKDSRHIILVQVYVDDIIFGSTNKAWCDEFEVLMKGEFEMGAMGELTFFLGLQVKQLPDGIFISQDMYVKDMLKKFDMESVRTATTLYEVPKPKSKDEPDDAVNFHLYRSMIGSLMYLTASRPDIMFAVSACSRHQLEAYSDSDYAGSHGDRKSTTGRCQFLGRKLISWQCKKQTIVANSSTEAEYVAAASCCGQASNAAGSTGVPAGVGLVPTGSYAVPAGYDDHNKVAYLEKGKGWEAYEHILDFLNRSHIQVTTLKNELEVTKKVLGGAVLKLVSREIDLDALHELASTSLGGDTTVEAAYTIFKASQDAHAFSDAGHDEDEVPDTTTMPFRRTRTKQRRLRKTFTSSAFEHFQENISAVKDTNPAGDGSPADAQTIHAGSTPIPTTGGVFTGSSMDPAGQAAAAAPSSSAIPAADKGKA